CARWGVITTGYWYFDVW
nr:immunoglobulin heavy chain junction region [Mus musculus]